MLFRDECYPGRIDGEPCQVIRQCYQKYQTCHPSKRRCDCLYNRIKDKCVYEDYCESNFDCDSGLSCINNKCKKSSIENDLSNETCGKLIGYIIGGGGGPLTIAGVVIYLLKRRCNQNRKKTSVEDGGDNDSDNSKTNNQANNTDKTKKPKQNRRKKKNNKKNKNKSVLEMQSMSRQHDQPVFISIQNGNRKKNEQEVERLPSIYWGREPGLRSTYC